MGYLDLLQGRLAKFLAGAGKINPIESIERRQRVKLIG